MNWDFIKKSIPLYMEAGKVTLNIGLWGILLATVLGMICCMVIYYKVRGVQRVVRYYIEISRNTPLLMQVFLLYFGLPKVGIKLSGTVCAVIGLGFLGGSYMAEAFRGGLDAVGKSQVESGLSIGLAKGQLIRYIIFPQALSVSMPQISANYVFLLKETSILSAIAIPEFLYVTRSLIGMYYKTEETLLLLTISYLVILLPTSIVLRFIERRLRHAEYGH